MAGCSGCSTGGSHCRPSHELPSCQVLPVPSSSTHAANCMLTNDAAAAAASNVHTRNLGKQFGCALPQLEEVSRGGGSTRQPAPPAMCAPPVAQVPSCPAECTLLYLPHCMLINTASQHSSVQDLHSCSMHRQMRVPFSAICQYVCIKSFCSSSLSTLHSILKCMRRGSPHSSASLSMQQACIHREPEFTARQGKLEWWCRCLVTSGSMWLHLCMP